MRTEKSLGNRLLALLLSVVIVLGMFPTAATPAFAAGTSTLTTNIGEISFLTDEPTEFTFTTTANADAGTYVLGTFEFSDREAVEKLEYLESQTGIWYEFYGDFGPAGTGFPMTDATSRFRVTFNKAGEYTVTASMVTATDRTVLCSVTEKVSVAEAKSGTLTTNIGEISFLTDEPTEFTFTTTANADAGTYVLGTFEFSDREAVEKLEYLESQTGIWCEFYGDFGPAGTGFPMTDATSRFRVTFNKAGEYTVTASMVTATDRTVLCSVTEKVSVAEAKSSTLTTNIGAISFLTDEPTEFTFTTTANDDAGTYVLGTFEFSDREAVEKLEYYDVQYSVWREFYGDFGPAGTGFPMTDATSRFRVTFNKAGEYTVTASMVTATDRTVLCSVTEKVSVTRANASILTTNIGESDFVLGKMKEFTFTTVANGDAGTFVLGTFEFSDPSAVEKLEYLESHTGLWYEFYGDFGPAATGFPMTDATSRFRVTFNKVGTYTVKAAMVTFEGRNELCSVTEEVTVVRNASTLTTNIGEIPFVTGQSAEFTFTTTANDDQDTFVLGTFEFSDPSAVEKLEYMESQTGTWYEFYGDFGPAATGFPMTDATSRFRVTFNKSGTYTVTAAMVTFEGREVLCSVVEQVDVAYNPSTVATDISEKEFIAGRTAEFALTTTANEDKDEIVLGTFEFSDPSAVEKLEYQDPESGVWHEFSGDFGPTEGFPMTDGTIRFRVRFNKAGLYTVKASMVTVEGRNVLCSVDANILVKDGSLLSTNISNVNFVATKTATFTLTTVANADEGTLVVGSIAFSDPSVVEKLEYQDPESGVWHEISGDFGSADGFPVKDGTDLFRVSFKKSGSYNATITMMALEDKSLLSSVTGTAKVERAEQTGFGFKDPSPDDFEYVWLLNEVYTNVAEGGQTEEPITYKIVEGKDIAKINPTTGEVTFTDVGKVVVSATRPGNEVYKDVTAEYTITAVGFWSPFSFAVSNPTVTYEDGLTYSNELNGKNDNVTFAITSGSECAEIDTKTGVLTILSAGTVTVQATKKAGTFNRETTTSYTLTILKADQSGFAFKNAPSEIGWQTEPVDTLELVNGMGDGKVAWEITEGEDVAAVDGNGRITFLKLGTFTIQAQKAGDNCYNPSAEITATIRVVKGEQEFGFAKEEDAITYNDNGNKYPCPAIGGNTAAEVIYSSSDETVATVDNNGLVTILKPGTVIIHAFKAGDDWYKDADDSYTLEIKKAENKFAFEEGERLTVTYGTKTVVNSVMDNASTGEMAYSISANDIGASIDANGLVTFADSETKVGTVTVTVSIAADDYYLEGTKSYAIVVDYLAKPAEVIKPSGATLNNSGWYTGELTITAPTGYKISYDNELTTEDWSDSVIFATEGADLTATIYLQDENGYMTDAIEVKGISIDLADPTNLLIEYEEPTWQVILNKITFGIYEPDELKVTISAEDAMSGIESLTYNIGNGDTVEKTNGERSVSRTFTIKAQHRNDITLSVSDIAGRVATLKNGCTLVLDNKAPVISPAYEFKSETYQLGDIFYTQGYIKITFTINEANFDLSGLDIASETGEKTGMPVVKVNGTAQEEVTWTRVGDTSEWQGSLTLSDDGDYTVTVDYTDPANNKMSTYAQAFRIDSALPSISVEYSDDVAKNGNCYTARSAVLVIEEHNFDPRGVRLKVEAKNILGDDVDVMDYEAYAKDPAEWHNEGDVHTLELPFAAEAIYTVEVLCEDMAGNDATKEEPEFVVDNTPADNVKIVYSKQVSNTIIDYLTFGLYEFYQSEVLVTVSAEDVTSGVDCFEISYTREDGVSETNKESFTSPKLKAELDESDKKLFSASYPIPAQARGSVSVKVADRAGKESCESDQTILVVDDKAPEREVSYAPYKVLKEATMLEMDPSEYKEGDAAILYYKDEAVVTFKITEANFDLSMQYEETKPVIKVNDAPVAVEWTQDGDVWTAVYTITGDGDYVVAMTYMDLSTNKMVDYESCKIAIDGEAPKISVKHLDGEPVQTIDAIKYYDENQEVQIQITDHNFRANDVVLTVDAENSQGESVDISGKAYADYAKDRTNWTSDGDVHTLDTTGMLFDTDAIYSFDIAYKDICDNEADDYAEERFVIDHKAPVELQVSYSTPVFPKIFELLTFGFYQSSATVTLTAKDETAGVDYIEMTVSPEGPASATDLAMPENLVVNADGTVKSGTKGFIKEIASGSQNGDLELSFEVPAQFRGKFSFVAYDRSGYSSNGHDEPGVMVVDSIAPEYTVSYNPSNVVDISDLTDMSDLDVVNGIVDITSKDASRVMYFSTDAVATIKIAEANFDPEAVTIEVLNAKDEAVIGWTQTDWSTAAEAGKADVHTKTITISSDGDYRIKVYYQDYSTNEPVDYLSQWIVVDKTAPVINVKYSNVDIKNTIEDRDYFADVQTATITIEERNFRADDVVIKVTAKDVLGADVLTLNSDGTVKAYADQGANRKSWTAYETGTWHTKDDTFVITLNYTADANYTFDIEYQDLARNKAADYEADLFTVDTTAPEKLEVSYSTSVLRRVLESITFGYYNATVTVTISATDATAGVHHFAYSYINSPGVSSVNAELLNQAIQEADISYDGAVATAKFNIPKMVLRNDNQFNGTVEFTSFDRSENSTEMKDTTRIIVDNISPTATITYNAPVQEANGISYYDGNIEGTISITEANFDSRDVVVTVTKDSASFPVNVAWRDNSVDSHVGSFTLSEDGDYIVSVQYADKSGNQMAAYTSNQLTLDTVKPTIHVSNIQANSANNDETYGFTIEINDINLDQPSLNPVLTAVVMNAAGVYETKEIDLGETEAVVAGQTYTFTVENLTEDALYTLTCEAKDMSANTTKQMILDDERFYEEVQFSINRNGSVFAYGNDATGQLVNQYHVYSVDEDLLVLEINVDPIEEYSVTLNGVELAEGTDYTTEQTSGSDEWSKRTYIINKNLFTAEGEYSVIVSSVDKTKTTAYSDVKGLVLSFVVDQTAPILTITGLESGGRYQTDEQSVMLIPTDEGGRLNSLKVVVLNSDGNPLKDDAGTDISVRFDMSGEELRNYLEENNGVATFTVPKGLENQVHIICNDCALNADGVSNEYNEIFTKVTVSQNGWIIFYANKPLFYGTVAGVIALAALIIFLIVHKKKKKDKK